MEEMATPWSADFDGDIEKLVAILRRHPDEARQLQALVIVQSMSQQWRDAESVLDITDEVPLTAWVVRKKAESLLPRPQEDAIAETINPYDNVAWQQWLMETREGLEELFAASKQYHGGDRNSRHVLIRPGIKGASLGKLMASWPKLRPKKAPTPRIVAVDSDPLGVRIERVQQIVRETGERVSFAFLNQEPTAQEIVGNFLAVIHLWNQRIINVSQAYSYGDIWLEAEETSHG